MLEISKSVGYDVLKNASKFSSVHCSDFLLVDWNLEHFNFWEKAVDGVFFVSITESIKIFWSIPVRTEWYAHTGELEAKIFNLKKFA